MENIIWTDRVRNEEVLHKAKGRKEYPTHNQIEEG
jgi:hypothetical protein